MNPETGRIAIFNSKGDAEAAGYTVPVMRDLTKKERMEMQIRLYAPCACGSGKKFKFCCKTKVTA